MDDNLCAFCATSVEDQIHLFFNCEYVKQLWQELRLWLLSLNQSVTEWTSKEVLLGLIGGPPVINHLIMITKYYIYRSSISKVRLNFGNLKNVIKLYYLVEKQICLTRQLMKKFYGKWSSFVNAFESPL